jgi:hypothetical protein
MCCAVSIRYEPRQLDALIAIDCFKPALWASKAFHIDSEFLAMTLTGQ